jgi:hypothetical protein
MAEQAGGMRERDNLHVSCVFKHSGLHPKVHTLRRNEMKICSPDTLYPLKNVR